MSRAILDTLMMVVGLPRYLLFAICRLVFVAIALLLVNWFLPFLVLDTRGWVNNKERVARDLFVHPQFWLWSTNDDNAMTGDDAHKRRHPDPTTYLAMLCWVWRNIAQGFSWDWLGAPVDQGRIAKTWYGWRMGTYFQVRLPLNITFGWLLDASAPGRVADKKAFFVLGR